MLGLYVHVPFCSAICNYCNFNRGLFDAGLKARYIEALILEIERTGAPAAMPSRGHGEPRRGISISSRRGWGPAASEEKRAAADTMTSTIPVAMIATPVAWTDRVTMLVGWNSQKKIRRAVTILASSPAA